MHFESGQIPSEGVLHGEIAGLLDDGFVINHGHVWSLTSILLPTIEENTGRSALGRRGNGGFLSEISDLTPGTDYHYRSYIISKENEVKYGEALNFKTDAISPLLSIDEVINDEEGAFTNKVVAKIADLPAGLLIKSYGIVWGEDPFPAIETDLFVSKQSILSTGSPIVFESEISLQTGAIYIRPFLLIGDKVYYGNDVFFQLNDVWLQGADFSGGLRRSAVAFSIGQKGYVGTGWDEKGDFSNDFWEYEPERGVWTQRADFPGGLRESAVGFSIDEKGYILTGQTYDENLQGWLYKKDFWEYDPATDTWTQKADFRGEERQNAVGFSIDGKGYVGTGFVFDEARGGKWRSKKDFWEYDPQADSWTQKADFGGGFRRNAVSFTIDGKAYVGTGLNARNGYVGTSLNANDISKDFWEYDPATDAWTQKADFGGDARHGAVGFSISQKGYLGTGWDEKSALRNDFWEYNPQTDSWTQRADFGGGGRLWAAGFSIGQRGYIGTGWRGGQAYLKDFWEYQSE